MTNNIAVALGAGATGMLAGIGPVYMMLFNGLMIGVVGSACFRTGMSVGAVELRRATRRPRTAGDLHRRRRRPAAWRGILFPASLPRRDSIAEAGGEAVRLLLGVVPLLVIAGLIEGFVSPTPMARGKVHRRRALLVLLAYLSRGWRPVDGASSLAARGSQLGDW